MLGIIATFIQSRLITESTIQHSAASSFTYGLIEQIKGAAYQDETREITDNSGVTSDVRIPAALPLIPPINEPLPHHPNLPSDMNSATSTNRYLKVLFNQNETHWLKVAYKPIGNTTVPAAPTALPAPNTIPAGAINNTFNIPLTSSGAQGQQMLKNFNIWIWIEEIDPVAPATTAPNISQLKKITFIYSYEIGIGSSKRIVRDMEIILRTNYKN